MCCLKNEQAAYEALAKNSPSVGSIVETPDGKGTVTAVSLLKGIVTVAVGDEDKTVHDYRAKDLKIIKRNNRKDDEKINMAELKGLED